MQHSKVRRLLVGIALMALAAGFCNAVEPQSQYFDLGARLVEEFRVINHGYISEERFEFVRTDPFSYRVLTPRTRHGIPEEDKLVIGTNRTDWVLGWSGETWFTWPHSRRVGASWHQMLRGNRHTYAVEATDETVAVPAGEFKHCARISISWIEHAHDASGPQRTVVHLAPHLGIIKEQDWNNDDLEIEKVLTKCGPRP